MSQEDEVSNEDEVSEEEIEDEVEDTIEVASSENQGTLNQQLASIENQLDSDQNNLALDGTGSINLTSSVLNPSSALLSINNINAVNNLGSVPTLGSNNILSGVASLGTNNLLGSVSSLGAQGIGTVGFSSVLGENNALLDMISVEDSFTDSLDDGEVILEEVEQVSEENNEETSDYSQETDDTTDDDSDNVTLDTDPLIISTSGNDTIIGGAGSTDFFYDFSTNTIGGNDTLSDLGTDTDDAIVFEGIPDNHSVILSRDPDGKNEIRIETFNTQDPVPSSNTNSINTINTPISDGTLGIENFILTTDDYYENNPEAIKYEGIHNVGQDDTDNMLQFITGTSENNLFSSSLDANSYWYKYSDHSDYYSGNNSDLGQTSPNYPYDATKLESRIYFTKEGNDTLSITDNTDTQYIANMGDGDDTVQMPYYNTIEEGSFFDGNDGTDSLDFFDGNDHLAFNSDNYDDALLDTTSSILSEEGNATNVDSSDHSYFKNFEEIQLGYGNDTVFFAGDPDNNIEILGESGDDSFTFNHTLTKNVTATGGNGVDVFNINESPDTGTLTLKGGAGNDTYNFTTNISSTISAGGGYGNDTFSFVSADIAGDVTLTASYGDDIYKFHTVNDGTGLTINDYVTTDDTFSFNSAAFQGSSGHVLVFGDVVGDEFMPDSTDIEGAIFLHAYNEMNTEVSDLLSIDNDYWYYDTTDGYLYYDETADQHMSDAVTVAKVTDSAENALDNTEILSSEIDYFSTST